MKRNLYDFVRWATAVLTGTPGINETTGIPCMFHQTAAPVCHSPFTSLQFYKGIIPLPANAARLEKRIYIDVSNRDITKMFMQKTDYENFYPYRKGL